jgi:hypothetical protein
VRQKEMRESFEDIATYQSNELPMKYVGIPIDKKRIMNCDWNGPIGKLEKKFGG